jgi:FtsP/CotA-like multicopper oxidase with cupredoxin domain
MHCLTRLFLAMMICALVSLPAFAQCPARPNPDTIVQDAPSIVSQNGVLKAELTLGHSVDANGYTHYCYMYQTSTGVVEAPTLRLNPGDRLLLRVKDNITGNDESVSAMDMPSSGTKCGDAGMASLNATNMHFHGMNVPPTCHQDDVLTTLIQPGTPGFLFDMQIPLNEPPGLYWYHPHVHGFTEFQVNGGAAGAIVVEGMDKFRPAVAGLAERVFTVRQQFLVPWVPGPFQLTFNFEQAGIVQGPSPIITMKPGEKQFWRVLNATLQDFMPLQVWVNGTPQPVELIALDGYPLAEPRSEKTILVPPAGRAEFIVQAPPAGADAFFYTLTYPTGLTGNPDIIEPLAKITLSNSGTAVPAAKSIPAPQVSMDKLKFSGLLSQTPTAERKLYFSEEFGGTNGPIQFYITVDGQKQKVFQPNEDPAITTHVGAVEDWTIENRALETHDFHIHQIHFQVLEIDGKPAAHQDLRDSIEIPFWAGSGPFHSVKLRMDFRDPNTAGTFVFHCHILLHEDLGMMHKILVKP